MTAEDRFVVDKPWQEIVLNSLHRLFSVVYVRRSDTRDPAVMIIEKPCWDAQANGDDDQLAKKPQRKTVIQIMRDRHREQKQDR